MFKEHFPYDLSWPTSINHGLKISE